MLSLCLTHSQRGGIKREKSQLQQAVFKGVKRREAMVIQKMLAVPLTTFETISQSQKYFLKLVLNHYSFDGVVDHSGNLGVWWQ